MDSWRDAASPQAQDDLDGLLDAALAPAHRMLADHGEFVPFAVALDTSGETGTVMGDPGSGERPSSDEVLDVLIAGLRSDRNALRAVALVADVRMSDSDAV